jgi:hypothetical protein
MIGPTPRIKGAGVAGNFTITPLTPEQRSIVEGQLAADRARRSPVSPGAFPGYGSGVENLIPIGGQLVRIIVPPGGFAGFAQQTPATQRLFSQAAGRRGGQTTQRRRRRKAKAAAAMPRRRRRRSAAAAPRRRRTRRPARLVKGSAAAKRYMASIRRKRRR